MEDHIKSIRNWHYLLLIANCFGLTLVFSTIQIQRTKELAKWYDQGVETSIGFTASPVYREHIDLAIQSAFNGDTSSQLASLVRAAMEGYYASYLNLYLDQFQAAPLPENWTWDRGYSNERILLFAEAMYRYLNSTPPDFRALADSLKSRSEHSPGTPLFPTATEDHIHTDNEASMIRVSIFKCDTLPACRFVSIPRRALSRSPDPDDDVRIALALSRLRFRVYWKDIRDLCYSDTKAYFKRLLEHDPVGLPLLELTITRPQAVILYAIAVCIMTVLMFSNLRRAILLFEYPQKVTDLGYAFTSAYIGINPGTWSLLLNFLMLVLFPLILMCVLCFYGYLNEEWKMLTLMTPCILVHFLLATRIYRDLRVLAFEAERHWRDTKVPGNGGDSI